MSFADAESVVRTVLYEGFSLYPYRPAPKNRPRWMLGTLSPGAFCRAECLVEGDARLRVEVRGRFLQLSDEGSGEGDDDATEREVDAGPVPPNASGMDVDFQFERGVRGHLGCCCVPLREGLFRVGVTLRNDSQTAHLASAHLVLRATGGQLVSSTDPPPQYRAEVDACRNAGLWPVLVGSRQRRELVLASPIILYDFPQVAPESPTSLFDGTEIDEILSLRILTLTDAEKRLARKGGGRVAALLDRVEALTPAELSALHGRSSLRERAPGWRPGDRVRLVPRGRADAFDVLLAGKAATVLSVEEDVEGQRYVTVTVDEDPGRELGRAGQPGHRFFFRTDEVEPL